VGATLPHRSAMLQPARREPADPSPPCDGGQGGDPNVDPYIKPIILEGPPSAPFRLAAPAQILLSPGQIDTAGGRIGQHRLLSPLRHGRYLVDHVPSHLR